MLLLPFINLVMLALAAAAPFGPIISNTNVDSPSVNGARSPTYLSNTSHPEPHQTDSLNGRAVPAKRPNGSGKAISISAKRPKRPLDAPLSTAAEQSTSDLADLLQSFDMQTKFKLQPGASSKTTSLSKGGVSSLPSAIKFVEGSFDPKTIIQLNSERLLVADTDYEATSVLFTATSLSKDLVKQVSGEGGLSHLLYQQVGGPINRMLAAIGAPATWSIKAHGPAPMEDWRLVGDMTAAVMELKTSAVLTGTKLDLMMASLDQFAIKMMPFAIPQLKTSSIVPPSATIPLPTTATTADDKRVQVLSLFAENYLLAEDRETRQDYVKALEQVRADSTALTGRLLHRCTPQSLPLAFSPVSMTGSSWRKLETLIRYRSPDFPA